MNFYKSLVLNLWKCFHRFLFFYISTD